ncbi:MAG: response regulator [Campylobacterota bacterium]|nr:response regulator [Campylobacterota bacterium]
MDIDQNIIYDEFNDKLYLLEKALNEIKDGKSSEENINEVFRSIHTIKGAADLLYMFDVVRLTHKSEDILDEIRHNDLAMDSKLCLLFLEFKDYISLMVENTSAGVFDDTASETLAIYFDKEFTICLQKLQTGESTKVDLKTILVVDSSTITRYTIKQFAQEEGYSVFISDNEIDAFNKIENNEIDLVFCDLVTKDIDIKEFINNIRSNIRYDLTPIVMLVDKIDKNLKQYGKDIEAKAWLHKPINKDELLVVLKKILH